MGNINITVVDKIATNATPDVRIVCGNSGYKVTFDFDEEWAAEASKVARFVYHKGREKLFKEKAFSGNVVDVPILKGIDYVLVGVYAGDLSTTTPARVLCKRSILCDDAEEHITEEEKETLQTQIAELTDWMLGVKEDLDGQVGASVEAYLKENPPSGGVQFETDATLRLEDGILSVNTTNDMEKDNTLPITSAGVFATVGNIEALLKTI